MTWWWLSFADDERGFLGAFITEAPDFETAFVVSHLLNVNPGGQVAGVAFPEGAEMPTEFVDTLLTEEECRTVFGGKSIEELDGDGN